MPIGQSLIGPQPRINPFSQMGQFPPVGQETQELPRPPVATPPIAPPPEQQRERFAGWKAFFQQIKSDPNTRLALAQFFIGLTQEADSPQAAVGSALDRGVQTLQALRSQDYERQRQAAGDQREERRVVATERQAGVAEAGAVTDVMRLEQQGSQFKDNLSQEQRQHLDKIEFDRQKMEKDEAYQKELLRLRQEELNMQRSQVDGSGAGGVQGSLWTRLREAMLADPSPELAAIADPEARRRRAELMAADYQNNIGQTREKVVANFIESQLLYIEHLRGDREKYKAAFEDLMRQANQIGDAAGLQSERITPKGPPIQTSAPPPQPNLSTGGVFPPGSTTPQQAAPMAPGSGVLLRPGQAAPPAQTGPRPVGAMNEAELQQELEELIRRGQIQR